MVRRCRHLYDKSYKTKHFKESDTACLYRGNNMKNTELLLSALSSLLKNSPDLIFIKDTELRYVAGSSAFHRMVNLSDDPLACAGKTDYEVFPRELAERYRHDDLSVLEAGVPIIEHFEPLPEQHGKCSYSSTSKYIIKDDDGNTIGLCGVGRDVTAQVELMEERERREHAQFVFDDVMEADLTVDRVIRVYSDAWDDEIGVSDNRSYSEQLVGFAQQFVHPEYLDEFCRVYNVNNLLERFSKGDTTFTLTTLIKRGGPEYRFVEFKSNMYRSQVTNTVRAASYVRDTEDDVRNTEALRLRAETDPLTGLLNRTSIVEQITARLEAGKGVHALLFVDLDYFKLVNDNYGHSFGDKILQEAAARLKRHFPDGLIGRVGGDEFVVFLENISDEFCVRKRVKEIFNGAVRYTMEDGHLLSVTCSVGVSIYNACVVDGKKSIDELYSEADRAMYRAKDRGRNGVAFFGT